MRISTRTGRNTRVSMSPMGWLFFGPLIVAGYLLYWTAILAVGAVTLAVAAIGAHLANKASAKMPIAKAPTLPAAPEDAVPPGMAQRPRA